MLMEGVPERIDSLDAVRRGRSDPILITLPEFSASVKSGEFPMIESCSCWRAISVDSVKGSTWELCVVEDLLVWKPSDSLC